MTVIKRIDLIEDEAFFWPRAYAKSLEALARESKALGEKTKPTKKAMDELAKVQRAIGVETERSTKKYRDQKARLDQLRKTTRESVKDINSQAGAYNQLSRRLDETRNKFKNLAAQNKGNTTEAKKLREEARRLDAQLKKIDASVGQNQRSVGKYSNAIKGVTARFLGWGAAILIVGRGLRDAWRRIREYDKAIVELSGVLRVSRKELEGLEKLIISVAGVSTKTSTEVAQLATTLATLGKSEAEIKNLLKPVNDLSISLNATSEEAGQLLVGTLNAFGESSKEAKRYAEVIANMRISSSLDFEKIKDSLGFVAPTAKAVGITIEGLGARIGVLVNNSVKASRAGRLLNSSFARLIKQGLTLEDALDEINVSTNKTKTASELFGTESFTLALILAENRDEVAKLTKEYENSKGVLDELMKKQLTSFNAKLDILDSAWEKLIFTMTKGDNFIAKDLKASISILSGWLNKLSDAISGSDTQFENWKNKIKESAPSTDLLTFSIEKLNKKLVIQATLNEILKKRGVAVSDKSIKAVESYTQQIAFLNGLINENAEAEKEAAEAAEKVASAKAKVEAATAKAAAKAAAAIAKKAADELLARQKTRLAKTKELHEGLTDIQTKTSEEIKAAILQEADDERDHSATLLSIEEKLQNDLKAIRERTAESQKAIDDRAAAAAQLLADTKAAIIEKSFDVAGELGNRFTSLRIEQIGQELTALEFARDRELESAGENERAKFIINEQFDKERRKLQKKQVIAERANAIFQIALNTAIGISAALKTPLLIPFIAAIGAIQAAAVLAAPIPQFDEGSESTPDTYQAGEKRPEFRKSKKTGKWSFVSKPTVFKDSPGDTIIGGGETDSLLGDATDLLGDNLLSSKKGILGLLNNDIKTEKKGTEQLAYILKSNNEKLINTIKNKKEVAITVTDKGSKVTEKSGNFIIDRIDYYYSR